jgi:hypothetical protein
LLFALFASPGLLLSFARLALLPLTLFALSPLALLAFPTPAFVVLPLLLVVLPLSLRWRDVEPSLLWQVAQHNHNHERFFAVKLQVRPPPVGARQLSAFEEGDEVSLAQCPMEFRECDARVLEPPPPFVEDPIKRQQMRRALCHDGPRLACFAFNGSLARCLGGLLAVDVRGRVLTGARLF